MMMMIRICVGCLLSHNFLHLGLVSLTMKTQISHRFQEGCLRGIILKFINDFLGRFAFVFEGTYFLIKGKFCL